VKFFARVLQSIAELLAGTVVAFALSRAAAHVPLTGNGAWPVVVRYLVWLSGIVRGDFGWSTSSDQPVAQLLRERLPATLELWLMALIGTVALGAILGIMRARLRAPFPSAVLAVLLLFVRSFPAFLLGLLLLTLTLFTPLRPGEVGVVFALAVAFGAWSAGVFADSLRADGAGARITVRRLLPPLAMTIALIAPALLAATLIVKGMSGVGRPFFSTLAADAGGGAGMLVVYWAAIVTIKLAADLWLAALGREPGSEVPARRNFVLGRSTKFALAGCVVLGIAALGAKLAGDPYYIDAAHWQGYPLAPGGAGHVLGTDENGRDLLSRLLFALRTSLGIAAFAALAATGIGLLVAGATARLPRSQAIGAALAATGIRSFAAFPLVAAIAAMVITMSTKAAVVPELLTTMIAAVSWPAIVTAIHSAQPGTVARTVVSTAIGVTAGALLFEVTLSAFGIGVQPPVPSLGNMLVNALSNLTIAPWVAAGATVAIIVTLFALIAASDGLRGTSKRS
jgi:peptide/nickel transport system permease protein